MSDTIQHLPVIGDIKLSPMHPLLSKIAYGFVRDSITIDSAFADELQKELTARQIPPNSTLLIAARHIKHASKYTLRFSNYNLIIAADHYDANGGNIDVSGVDGAAGAPGPTGPQGYASAGGHNDRPGGLGGNGKPGGSPTTGMQVALYCKTLKSASLLARGGHGAAGGPGGAGGAGGSGYAVVISDSAGKSKEAVGTAGGKGGNGGAASPGATGGRVTVAYIDGSSPVISVVGGNAAAGGAAGVGGKGGPGSPNGANGTKGANSVKGADGVISIKKVAEAELWATLRNELGPQATNWAAYRERMGDFMFRNGYGKGLFGAFTVGMAATEFRHAGFLNPASSAATRLAMLLAGMNPLSLQRELYITPDFPRYEKAFTDYAPLIQSMLHNAKDLLLHADNIQSNKDRMTAQLNHFEAQKSIAQGEMAEALLEKSRAEGVVAAIDARINELETEIDAKRAEMAAARMELDGAFLGTVVSVIGAVVAAVGACVTAGPSLAAVPALLVAAEKCWSVMKKDPQGNLYYDDAPLADVIDWRDENGKLSPQVKPEIKALAAGLGKVVDSVKPGVKAVMDLIDKVKVLDDIGRATVNGEQESQLKQLVKRCAELEFEKAQGKIVVNQAELRIKTVEIKIKQAEADIAAAQAMVSTWTKNNVLLGNACRMVIRFAREYMDLLLRFQFMATRALEIYAHRDYSDTMPYALGYLPPDQEEHAYTALARGDATRALSLMEAYLTSWSKLPSIIALRNEYETYRQGLVTQSEYWTISDPAKLAAFRQTAKVELEVTLADLLDNRFECKMEGAVVALDGATAGQPLINCVLMHEGTSKVQRMNGTVLVYDFPPRGAPLLAAKSDSALGQIPASEPEAFWGRSPAARWRLYIEPEVMANAAVNLSGVQKIVIGVKYKAFVPPLGSNAKGNAGNS